MATDDDKWPCPGVREKCPKGEIQFIVQSLALIIVICVSLYNLTKYPDGDNHLWVMLLSGACGIFVPTPVVKKDINL